MTQEQRAEAMTLALSAAARTRTMAMYEELRAEEAFTRAEEWERADALGMSSYELAEIAGGLNKSQVQKALARLPEWRAERKRHKQRTSA